MEVANVFFLSVYFPCLAVRISLSFSLNKRVYPFFGGRAFSFLVSIPRLYSILVSIYLLSFFLLGKSVSYLLYTISRIMNHHS
ncbi:hypothetical protein QBC38DRAFT_144991 [Podospora fimiseda]|uniref:Uncharacterized protein n=1 Tax=Podospora fimiseda TaxID=252190 RepID=A0AAN7H8H7_9PEZI|nr:hypothetical protein QBC38DRAFT_144991 [Podospora fimiseda]